MNEHEKLLLKLEELQRKIDDIKCILLRGCSQDLAIKLRYDLNELEIRRMEVEERLLFL